MDVGPLAFSVVMSSDAPAAAAAPDPPAIVLVHGIGVSHRYLRRLHEVLAETREVVSVDLPGFGGLPKPPGDLDVPAMATALATVIESLGRGPVALVGHSMGTQWVVEVGLQRPDLVTDVVIMGPVTDSAHRSVVAQTAALAVDTLGETPRINAIVFSDYLRCGPRWYLAQLRHMLTYPIEERVAQLKVPLVIIRGARDPIAGLEWCRHLRDRAARATVVQIPGGHHVVQESRPRAAASAILSLVTPTSDLTPSSVTAGAEEP